MILENRIKFFEGIRGVAALMVLVDHCLEAFYPQLFAVERMGNVEKFLAFSPLNIFFNGWGAVAIFFVMSGYVLSFRFFIFEKTPGYEKYHETAPRLALRRYFRFIVPVFSVALICYFLLKFNLVFINEAYQFNQSFWLDNYKFHTEPRPHFLDVLYYSFIGVFAEKALVPNYDAALWTMFREFWGSVLIYFLIYFFFTKKFRFFIFISATILFLESSVGLIGISVMLFGLCLADHQAYQKYLDKFLQNKIIFYAIAAAAVLLMSMPKFNFEVTGNFYQFLFLSKIDPQLNYGFGALLFMILALNSQKIQDFFSSKILVELGKISFALYLIHIPIIISVSSFIFAKMSLVVGPAASAISAIFASIIISLASAKLIYRYIDLSGITLSKIILPNLSSRK